MKGEAGKGDRKRPMFISSEEYGRRFENIFGKKSKKRSKRGSKTKTT